VCVEVYCSVLQRVAVWQGNGKESVYPIRTPVWNRRIHNKSTDDGIRVCVCMCARVRIGVCACVCVHAGVFACRGECLSRVCMPCQVCMRMHV